MKSSLLFPPPIMRHAGARRALLLASLLLCVTVNAEQSAPPKRKTNPQMPMLYGHPSLEGTWTNSNATPFERPPEFAAKAKLDTDDASLLEKRMEDFRTHRSFKPNEIGHDNEAFIDLDVKVLPSLQTSLIVEPANGRLPLRPEAEKKRDYNLNNYDSYESMSPWDRCVTRGPAPMLPANYNNGYQIVQTPTHVMIVSEMIHEARVIPIDGTPHSDAKIRTWAGDSRGRWEGNTLVVNTIHFNNRGWLITHNGAGRVRGVPYSESLRLVERFTRVDANTLQYEITFDDPEMFTSAWKVALPLQRDDAYQIYEYACHEGNSATDAILRGARVQEAAAKK